MTDDEQHYCPAMTHPGSFYVDPEPPSYCDAEVEEEGQSCPVHEEQDSENPWGNDENEEWS